MKELEIIVFSPITDMRDVIVRVINNEEKWKGYGVPSLPELMVLLKQKSIDIVLFDAGVSTEEEIEVSQKIKEVFPKTIIIQHYGGGSGLLKNEIMSALEGKESSADFIDDANTK
jgi:DNA-binding NtrC family response regulator